MNGLLCIASRCVYIYTLLPPLLGMQRCCSVLSFSLYRLRGFFRRTGLSSSRRCSLACFLVRADSFGCIDLVNCCAGERSFCAIRNLFFERSFECSSRAEERFEWFCIFSVQRSSGGFYAAEVFERVAVIDHINIETFIVGCMSYVRIFDVVKAKAIFPLRLVDRYRQFMNRETDSVYYLKK